MQLTENELQKIVGSYSSDGGIEFKSKYGHIYAQGFDQSVDIPNGSQLKITITVEADKNVSFIEASNQFA